MEVRQLRRGVLFHGRNPYTKAYHAWRVYYLTQRGSVWLEEGYAAKQPIPVGRYLKQHPEALP